MLRERLTITLDADLLAAIDQLQDGQTLRNRSQTIEHLLKEGIGLHELRQAVLFVSDEYPAELLGQTGRFCSSVGIRELLLGLPAGQTARFSEVSAALAETGTFQLTHVPTDFGSGGALVLQRARLEHPFLIISLASGLRLPERFLPMYAFHRQHHAPLTRLLAERQDRTFVALRVDIASPELLADIPAGISDLEADVFPQLAKQGKVRGYVSI